MKKFYTLLFCLTLMSSFSQAKFVAHETELRTDQDIFEFLNTPASELYQLSKVWFSEIYKNPDRVIVGDVENKLLKVNGYSQIPTKGILGKNSLNMKYSLQIDFKEDKIKVNISNLEGVESTHYSMFFKKDGSRRDTKEVQRYLTDLERYFNNLIDNLLLKLKNDNDW